MYNTNRNSLLKKKQNKGHKNNKLRHNEYYDMQPICEAKFHPHSYTENAVAYTMRKINIEKRYYMVDIDIATNIDVIRKYAEMINLTEEMLKRVNKYRKIIGNITIKKNN